jgi:hypothetical protein
MILPVRNFSENKIQFKANDGEDNGIHQTSEMLLNNNFSTRSRIGLDKMTKAFTIYPAKGLKGSKNSNFYEFLTMGTVPYIIGSFMLISIFNSVNKFFPHFNRSFASKLGHKMALGVGMYALFKSIAKPLITTPVKWLTGIDTELPYSKVYSSLQEEPNNYHNLTNIEYHKVGESVDFTRWDLLYGNRQKGEIQNFRYDKIAKKVGLGENLNDSDQEVKPIYKEVLIKTKLAKSFSSYMWAATGVALAFQKSWEKYFNVATLKFWKGKEFAHSLKVLGNSFVESIKELYHGSAAGSYKDSLNGIYKNSFVESRVDKYSGKALLGIAVLSTVLGVANAVHIKNKPSKVTEADVMKKHKESVVN